MNILGINQPYFFPYLGFFQLIKACDTFLLHDAVPHKKQSWITRNRIQIVNQEIAYIRPHLEKSSPNLLINEVKLDNRFWKQKLLAAISKNYGKSPFYDETLNLLKIILAIEADKLSDFNIQSIMLICKHLNISTKIVGVDDYILGLEKTLSLNTTEKEQGLDVRTKRIIKLCDYFKCNHYYNAIGGLALYDKTKFSENGVQLKFIKMKSINEILLTADIRIDLSILHLLFNLGKKKTIALLSEYELT